MKYEYKKSPWFRKNHYPPVAEKHIGMFLCAVCGKPSMETNYGTYYKHELFCSAGCMIDWHETLRNNQPQSDSGDKK